MHPGYGVTTGETATRVSRLLAAAAAIGALACSGGTATTGPAQPATLTVKANDRYWSDLRTSDGVVPVSLTSVEGIVASDPALGLRTIPATLTGWGWELEDVPGDDVYVAFVHAVRPDGLDVYVENPLPTFTTLDLGRDLGGRPGVQFTTAPTPVSFEWTGLTPWDSANDTIQLFSSAQLWNELTPAIADGASEVTIAFDWFRDPAAYPLPWPVLDRYDWLWLVQYRQAPTPRGGAMARSAVASTVMNGVTIVDGAASPIAIPATFASDARAPQATLPLDWRVSRFEAFFSADFPPLIGGTHTAGVYAVPAGGVSAALGPAYSIDLLDVTVPPGTPDTSFGAVPYANIVGSNAFTWCSASYGGFVRRFAPGATTGRGFHVGARVDLALPLFGAVTPIVGPARSPRIAGKDALVAQQAVGTSPVLSWLMPSLGKAGLYQVVVSDLTADASGNTVRDDVAVFFVTFPQLQIPPGLLQPAHAYVAQITSYSSPGRLKSAPWRAQHLPEGSATIATDVFVP